MTMPVYPMMKWHWILCRWRPALGALWLLGGLPWCWDASADSALGCADFYGQRYAFARVSPLQVAAKSDFANTQALAMEFSRAYPVIEVTGPRVRFCVGSTPYWARRSHLFLTRERQWLRTRFAAMPKERPRLRFWYSQQRLSAHLAERSAALAPPDYEEIIPPRPLPDLRLPIAQQDVLETSVSRRQLQVASVLLPFATAALEDYRRVRLQQQADLVLLLDSSGSTNGFAQPFLRRLAEAAREMRLQPRVLLIAIDGDGRHAPARLATLAEHAAVPIAHRIAANPDTPTAASNTGFSQAAERMQDVGVDLPILIAAGGDITLDTKRWYSFGYLAVSRLTPEIQQALSRSAAKIGHAVLNAAATELNEWRLALSRMQERAAVAERRRDSSWLARLTNDMGFIAVIPYDPDAPQLTIAPAFVNAETRWFAVPLWVVVRGELLMVE